ncbi:MAG: hypothetical protein WCN98_06280, partial [Verrucomicrobiaceae bacterium]
MRASLDENVIGRTGSGQLAQNPRNAMFAVANLRVKLPVRKRARATLAELHVRFGIELQPASPKAGDIARRFYRLSDPIGVDDIFEENVLKLS